MPLIAEETIQQVASLNDIVDVIGGYFPLRRAGVVFTALCPFHREKTPSFNVNPHRQMFKCFGCGAGGGVIQFVQQYENMSFPDAVRKLAARAGIRIVDAEMSPEDEARYGLRKRLLALHAEAADFFHHWLLKKPTAEIARAYLKGRGISGEVAKSWKLGYAPEGWDTLLQHALGRGFEREEILRSGLVSAPDNGDGDSGGGGRMYDRFRNRVMFPICNDSGEVIAFSGRVLEADAKAAKYVNSPETPLFTKGAVLFGLNKSKRALIDAQSAIVCEGQLDLITAFEAGVQNVIAPQGTAFTPRQAHILKRYVGEVVLCFDADAAGEKAAERSLPSLLAEGLHIRVATMPKGEDPDSLIRGQGADAFRERITGARDFFDEVLAREAGKPGFATPRGRTDAARKIAGQLSLVTDAVMREAVLQRVAQRLELPITELAKLVRPVKPNTKSPAAPSASDSPDDAGFSYDGDDEPPIELDSTLRLLALVILRDADARAWVMEEEWRERLAGEFGSELLVKILEADFEPDNAGSAAVFLSTLRQQEQNIVSDLLSAQVPPNTLAVAHDAWRELEARGLRRKLASLKSQLREDGIGIDEILVIQKEILALQNRLSYVSRPLSQQQVSG